MGNVHPYPRYLSREPSLHGHPTPMKKYGLLCNHLGCKSAIKRTVHLLLCDAETLLTRGSIGLVPPANKPFPCLSCCSPPACRPHPEQKNTSIGELHFPRLTLQLFYFSPTSQSHWTHRWDRSEPGFWPYELLPLPSTAGAALPPIPWGLIHLCPQGKAIFALDLQG